MGMAFYRGEAVPADLFALFWRDEAGALEWLRDFRCDGEIDRMVLLLTTPEEEEFAEPEVYLKSELTTLGSDLPLPM